MRTVLVIVLSIVGVLSLVFGLGVMVGGTSAIHQILCAIYFLIFAVCTAGLGVMAGVKELNATTKSEWNDYAKHLLSQADTPALPVRR